MNLFTNLALVQPVLFSANRAAIPAAELRMTPDGVPYRSTDYEFTSEELAAMRSAPPTRPADSTERMLTGLTTAAIGNAAAQYLEMLERGDTERLRKTLQEAIRHKEELTK